MLLINFLTLVTEFAAIALAFNMMGLPLHAAIPVAAVGLIAMGVTGSYLRWERVTLFLCLLDLTWIVIAFVSYPRGGGVMHNAVVPHRNDLELLRACSRLLAGGLPADLRPALVESLFDYRPDDWYSEHGIHPAPKGLPDGEARAEMLRIADYAFAAIPLPPALYAKVEAVRRSLRR